MEKSNKNSIFAALESATLPIEQRTRAELFVYMRMEYINPPLGTATLLANLQNEGLVIMDERKANAFLENYRRLSLLSRLEIIGPEKARI